MAAKKKVVFAGIKLAYREGGERKTKVYDIRGRNPEARQEAERLAREKIQEMCLQPGIDYLVSVYVDPISKGAK